MSKNVVTLDALELERFMPKPERGRDELDLLAVCKHACPVCGARPSGGCAWTTPATVMSWCAHNARRALVDDLDWLMKRAAVVGRDLDRALRGLERRGLRRFGLLTKMRRRLQP